jgi:RNA polymerase primary sigma factor
MLLKDPVQLDSQPTPVTTQANDADQETARALDHAQSREGDNCLRLYLSEIGKVQLLTREQEIELAARIKKGDKKAREEMIKANLRLVVKIARDYENLGLPLMDLISEGNIGLMKAVERFAPEKGAKLSTYAAWWIKQSVKRALANQSKTIRIPVHMVAKISSLNRTARRMSEVLGRDPSDEELGEELGISASRVGEMRLSANRPLSLDAPVRGEDASSTFGEIIEDQNVDTASHELEAKVSANILRKLVDTLSPREAHIVRARFGLDGSKPQNLEEVGMRLGVTRERIRQIQNKALVKLRALLEKLETPTPSFS